MLNKENIAALRNHLVTQGDLIPIETFFCLKQYVFAILNDPRYADIFYQTFYKHKETSGVCINPDAHIKPFKDSQIYLTLFFNSSDHTYASVAVWHNRIAAWEREISKQNTSSHYSRRVTTPILKNFNGERLAIAMFRLLQTDQSIKYLLPELRDALAHLNKSVNIVLQSLEAAQKNPPQTRFLPLLQSNKNNIDKQSKDLLEKAILDVQVRSEIFSLYLKDASEHIEKIRKLYPNLSAVTEQGTVVDTQTTEKMAQALDLFSQQAGKIEKLIAIFKTVLVIERQTILKSMLEWFYRIVFKKPQEEMSKNNWFTSLTDYLKSFDVLAQPVYDEQFCEFLRCVANDVGRVAANSPVKYPLISDVINQAKKISDIREAEAMAKELYPIINEGYYHRAIDTFETYVKELEINGDLFQHLLTLVFLHLDSYIFGSADNEFSDALIPGQQQSHYLKMMRDYWDDWLHPEKSKTLFQVKHLTPFLVKQVEAEIEDRYATCRF